MADVLPNADVSRHPKLARYRRRKLTHPWISPIRSVRASGRLPGFRLSSLVGQVPTPMLSLCGSGQGACCREALVLSGLRGVTEWDWQPEAVAAG